MHWRWYLRNSAHHLQPCKQFYSPGVLLCGVLQGLGPSSIDIRRGLLLLLVVLPGPRQGLKQIQEKRSKTALLRKQFSRADDSWAIRLFTDPPWLVRNKFSTSCTQFSICIVYNFPTNQNHREKQHYWTLVSGLIGCSRSHSYRYGPPLVVNPRGQKAEW